ncbi:MAG TPA: L,D-transpeptidase family protein [Caulobacteraceae bacterium]|jgi:murein L,D-transpeptidase YcbB/YkuD
MTSLDFARCAVMPGLFIDRPFSRREWLSYTSCVLIASCSQPGPRARQVGQALTDSAARQFYARRGWTAAWDSSSARSLAQAIANTRAHGLDPQAFTPKRAPGGGADEAHTVAALLLAKTLSIGFVDPHRIEPIFTLKQNSIDVVAGLAQALAQRNLSGWIESLAPADAEYKSLSAAYLAAFAQLGKSPPAPDAQTANVIPPASQVRQLAVNLERRRWLSRTPPAHRIDVNTAAAVFTYLKPGGQAVSARVVAGRYDHPTPCIEAAFHRLIANPPWRVPDDIAAKEILPKGQAYIASQDMSYVDGHLQQAAGPKSALGRVKFDVEDPYDIYLHDTPAKSLFAENDRHRSHGCVRVQNAVDFARGIAAETGKADEFDRALASTKTTQVDLGQSIPVRLLYHSAYVDPSGQLQMVADVYGADDKLAPILGLSQAQAAQRQESQVLFGP